MRNQSGRALQGPFGKLLIIYAKVHLTLGTRLLIHENVLSFVRSALSELMGHVYCIESVVVKPCDAGVPEVSRSRGLGLHVANRRG